MSGDSIKTLSVQVNVNASPLLNFFQTVGQQVNNLEKSLREANLPIEEISEKVGKMSLAAGHVSKEVADTIIHHGTSAQKAALITGRGLDELQGVAVKTAGTFLDLGKSIASAFKPSNMIAKLKTNLLGLAAPIAGAMAVRQLFSSYTSEGERLINLSEKIGVSVEKLDMWGKANRDAGGSAQAFQSALENWTKNGYRTAESFFSLGDKIAGMGDRQARRYLQNIYGISEEASKVFVKNKENAKAMAESYKDVAMTKEQAEQAREFNLTWDKFTDAVKAGANQILVLVVPVLQKFVSIFTGVISAIRKHIGVVKAFFAGLGALLAVKFVSDIVLAVKAMGGLTAAFRVATTAAKTFSAWAMANPLGLIVAAIALIVAALDDLYTFANGGVSVFENIVRKIGGFFGLTEEGLEELRATFKGFFDWVFSLPKKALEVFRSFFLALGALLDGDFHKLLEALGFNADQVFKTVGDAFSKWIKEPITTAIALIKEKWEAFIAPFTDQINKVKNFFGIDSTKSDKPRYGLSNLEIGDYEAISGGSLEAAGVVSRVQSNSTMSSVNNQSEINITNNIQTSDDPEAIAGAIGQSFNSASAQSRGLIGNANSGVVMKG